MYLLRNYIQRYAWGSRTALAGLRGEPVPTAEPEAELWMGAHPLAPSQVQISGTWEPLDRQIAASPASWLGHDVAQRFGGRLPFLMKVLAAAEPLSLQAHPSRPQAEAGFADEEARGVTLTAPNRNYKDANHKPEILCALTPFEALYGFRAVDRTLELLRALDVPALGPFVEALEDSPGPLGLRTVFEGLFALESSSRSALVSGVVSACARHGGAWAAECRWVERMAGLYPGDVGLVVVLLLNRVSLQPGEAVYLPAGNLHAYLEGVGVELMASSDNVLRGGLTRKHVDVPELLRVLDFSPIPPVPLRARRMGAEDVYETGAQDFRLSRLSGVSRAELTCASPQVLLCTRGVACLRRGEQVLSLSVGESAFVPVGPSLEVDGGAELFRATVGEP
jgi:mannose-6-phosphate isomerase